MCLFTRATHFEVPICQISWLRLVQQPAAEKTASPLPRPPASAASSSSSVAGRAPLVKVDGTDPRPRRIYELPDLKIDCTKAPCIRVVWIDGARC